LLHHEKIRDLSIECADRPTVTKTRLVSNGQQLIRLDEEEIRPAGADAVKEVIRRVEEVAGEADASFCPTTGRGSCSPKAWCRR
jgi:bifunctional ADP-heptose synthase (sugar kinase/adenylyltransferase)